jgi:hypothetical protein
VRQGVVGRLVAAMVVVSTVGAGLTGDARPEPDWPGLISLPPKAAIAAAPAAPSVAAATAAERAPAAQPSGARQGGASEAQRVVPAKLVIVRTGSIDSISAGVMVRRVARDGRAVSLATLAAAIPPSWMTVAGDTARLDMAVLLTVGTELDVDGVRTLQLVGGEDPSMRAFLATGPGQIRLRGVTVTSVDPASGQPVGPGAAARPYIRVSDGGSLTTIDSAITDLGTNPGGVVTGEPAISFGTGSTGTLTRTTLSRNSTGLVLAGSQGVHLQDVTVSESSSNGIILRGDRATVLSDVKAEHNGDNGVLVAGGSSGRPITGISTTGNHAYGVSVSGQSNLELSNLILVGDRVGGLELDRLRNSHVHNITTTDEPIGVSLHNDSTNPVLNTVSVSGGRTGVLVDETTTGLQFSNSTIQNADDVGVAYDGRDGALVGLTVKDSGTALRVEHGSGALTVDALSITGGRDGLVTSSGTPGIVVKNLSADGVSNEAIRNLGPGMHIVGGQIRGGRTGMNLQAPTTVTGMRVGWTSTGVRTSVAGRVVLDDVVIDAVAVGVVASPGSAVALRNSSVHAPHTIRGNVDLQGVNDFGQPPITVLGAIGLPLILLALILEFLPILLELKRQRDRRREYLRKWRALATNTATTRTSTPATCSACGIPRRRAVAVSCVPDSNNPGTCGVCVTA